MASGDLVALAHYIPVAANFAALDERSGGSTPAESIIVLDFDDTTVEYADFLCRLFNYAGGGLTITFDWSATSGVTNNVRWGAAIRRVQQDAEDIDASHTYSFNDASDQTTASASGEVVQASITFTDGVDMDSLANGESFILRIRRTAATSNMTGDAEMWFPTLLIKET